MNIATRTATATLADRLADFVVDARLEDLPAEVVQTGKNLTLKTMAGMLVGATTINGKRVLGYLKKRSQKEEVSVVGQGMRTSLWEGTLANSLFAHFSELEDDRFDKRGGAAWDITVVPPVLTMAEYLGLSGRATLEALIVGLEVDTRVCLLNTRHLGISHVLGNIGAAAGVGRALGLSRDELKNAFGMVLAAGTNSRANVASDAHFLESARQSVNGLMACELAQTGMTGNGDHLEYYLSNILAEGKVDEEYMIGDMGRKWLFTELLVKKYPCCLRTHRQLDSYFELADEEGLGYGNIAEIIIDAAPDDAHTDRPNPVTETDLQFSFQHVMACAMIDGDVDTHHILHADLTDAKLRDAWSRVTIDMHDDWPLGVMTSPSIITVRTTDGREFRRERINPVGSPDDPLPQEKFEELYAKFSKVALTDAAIAETYKGFQEMDALSDIKGLMQSLTFDLVRSTQHAVRR